MSLLPVAGQRALFLDRDGVINVNHGYVNSIENFDFVDGIFDLVRTACKAGYRVVVVTNQAGIGRGYYSEGQFHELSAWMCAQFEKHGAPIDRVYFSPYHPTAGVGKYRKDEDTRKPGPGAKHELGLSLEDSVLVGDKPSDILAGITAGVGTNVLFSDNTFVELAGLDYLPVRELKDVIPCLEGAVTTLAQR
ncbi:MAG: HAD family hydrolase [Betaproteobacteria bacterium]|nr:HAD family hydrolase [Betaproteobacteria bacterium]NBY13428.1 HAD family hydrolase [Betaproteobacteria bacterium]